MEENKKETAKRSTKKQVDNKVNKLSYEDLEAAANQIAAQFDAVRKENMNLKAQVQQLQLNDVYTELNFRFKVIENKSAFDPNFVDYCVNSIQEIMLPRNPAAEEAENTEE